MHQVGVGVLGPVFRTYDPAHDRLVAVKVFRLDITPEQVQTLVKALRRLIDADLSHPAIVTPITVGVEDDVPYLAQEYVTAESLDVALRHYAPATVETALPFVQHLAEAIDAAHERGIAHGGLHLRDIFVSPEEVYTTGFGVVTALEAIGLKGPIRRPYTAPEIIAGRAWGAEADRFALAAVTYELLTGKRAAGTGEQVNQRLAAIEGIAYQDGLQAVFATGLADAPETRYSSAVGFVAALRAAVGHAGGQEEEPVAPDLFTGLDSQRETTQEAWDEQSIVDAGMKPTEDEDNQADLGTEGAGDDLATSELREGAVEETDPALSVDDRGLTVDASEFQLPLEGTPVAEDADPQELRGPRSETDAGDVEVEVEEGEAEEESEVRGAPVQIAGSYGSVTFDDGGLDVGDAADQNDVGFAASVDEQSGDTAVIGAAVGPAGNRSDRRSTRVVSLLAVAAIAAVAAYGVGLRLGAPDDADDRELGAPQSAWPAGRDFSEVAVGDAEPVPEDVAVVVPDTPVELEMTPTPLVDPAMPPELPPVVVREAPELPQTPDPETGFVEPETGSGWLLIRTTPPGASVVVDGLARGRTPLSLEDVPFGTHRVRVSYTGYGSETREVSLSRDAGVASVGIDLVKSRTSSEIAVGTGSLQVESRPNGARVMVDGRLVGTTPVVVPDLADGSHRVRVERDGYQAWATTVDVSPSDQIRVAASLERVTRR